VLRASSCFRPLLLLELSAVALEASALTRFEQTSHQAPICGEFQDLQWLVLSFGAQGPSLARVAASVSLLTRELLLGPL